MASFAIQKDKYTQTIPMWWAESHISETELGNDIVKREAWAKCIILRRTVPSRRHKRPGSETSLWDQPFLYGIST